MNVTQVNMNAAAEADPGYGQMIAVLIRRRFWIVGFLAGSLGIALVMSLRQHPTYQSSMQLLVEPNYQGKGSSGNSTDPNFTDSNVTIDNGTQIALMRSSSLLKKAMVLLQPEFPEFDPNNPASVSRFRAALSVAVLEGGTSKKAVETKIYTVSYIDLDPEKTQKILKAMQKVYQEYNLEQQRLRLAKGLTFIDQQIPKVKAEMGQAEAALEQFRRQQGLIDPEAQAKAKFDALVRVQQEQQTTQTQIQELNSRFNGLQQQIALSPQQALAASRLSQSPRYQSLLAEIQKTELALEQQRLRFKDGTPQVQQLSDQRRRQLNLLQVEVSRILGPGVGQGVLNNGPLLSQGQLSTLDLGLVSQFVDAQVNLRAAEARNLSLNSTEQQLREELKRFPRLLAEFGRLEPEVTQSRETLKQLLKTQQDLGLEIARGGFDWQVVEEPELGASMGSSLAKNLLLGAVVGLFLGGVAAFAREATDDAVHSSDDLQKQVPIPLLGLIPTLALEPETLQPLQHLPFHHAPTLAPTITQVIRWQPFQEALDLLYQNIQLLHGEQGLQSLVITSALAGEGKSTLAVGLAISAARLHQRVLLVDADLRRPSLHKLLNLPNDRGLSTLLDSKAPIPARIEDHTSDLRSNISVLTAGPAPADPAKLLSSQRLRDVIATFERSYDLVLVDTPPVLGMVDAMLAASRCQGALLVGRIDRVTRTELTRAVTMLNKLNVIGVVASGASGTLRSNRYYHSKPEETTD
ncbi:MAG: GumC family protein [Leptolyngbya sp. BL-A-14]